MYLLLNPPCILSLSVYHHARLTIVPFVKAIWVIICTHCVLVRDKLYIIYKCSVLHALYALCMYVLFYLYVIVDMYNYNQANVLKKVYMCILMWFHP